VEYIKLTKDNIADEHICCAFSDKKSREGYEKKKEWLKKQFDKGYRFIKGNVRGKVFIEWVPAEQAWYPLDAPGFVMINCFWVSGKYKGQGYAGELLRMCLEEAKGSKGLIVLSSKKKRPYLADKKFFEHFGFQECDWAKPYFKLLFLEFDKDYLLPIFKDCAKYGTCKENGLVAYYSHQCPFTEYYVNQELARICRERGLALKVHCIDSLKKAQNHCSPYTPFSLFKDGRFVTHKLLTENSFNKVMA